MDAELLERAQKVAAMGNRSRGFTGAEFREIEDVYRLVIGHYVECYNCVVYRLIKEITQALNKEPLEFNAMAKYQFVPSKRGVKVIRHMENGETRVITSENLNKGDNAEFVLGYNKNLIEESKASKASKAAEAEEGEAPAPAETEAKPARKSEKK